MEVDPSLELAAVGIVARVATCSNLERLFLVAGREGQYTLISVMRLG